MKPAPYLLYVYPWMPFPRRVTIYLREKRIASSLVQIVPVSDPQSGDAAPDHFPPRPKGSLPILCIPNEQSDEESYTYVRQSIAIMNYLDELCDNEQNGFPASKYSMRGSTALARARETEILGLADELTVGWNPVRMFGTGAGSMKIPEASKEMIKWEYRTMATLESYFRDRDLSHLSRDSSAGPTIAEIVLYQFLEFVDDCYGRDMTQGSAYLTTDVYGRNATNTYPKLQEFYRLFKLRDSAKRDISCGEMAVDAVLGRMKDWNW